MEEHGIREIGGAATGVKGAAGEQRVYGGGMVRVGATTELGLITGAQSANETAGRAGVYGTDLGAMWADDQGRVFVVFGDTFGKGWTGFGGNSAGPDADWRSNTLAISTNTDLDSGLRFDEWITRPDGSAAQILERDRGTKEVTVIPNDGIFLDGKHYLHYMSVRRWGEPGTWDTNYAGIAVSTDGACTWSKPDTARWGNRWRRDHPFQIASLARDDDHVYLVGTTNGRHGPAYLARAEPDKILEHRAYEYWDGSRWGDDPFAAAPGLPGPVGELSVRYSNVYRTWLALYLDERAAAIVLRTAEELTGPWSDAQLVVSGADYPGLYGGHLHPACADREQLYFAMSQWGPYNVFFMRTELA